MGSFRVDCRWLELTVVCGAMVGLLSGCGANGQGKVAPPSIDPQASAAAAISAYDKDGDGKLSETELAACPAIGVARDQYDLDRDGAVSESEIADHLTQLYSVSVGLVNLPCRITQKGRPLEGADVRFVPEAFLGESLPAAVGKTGPDGTVYPSIPQELLPQEFQAVPMMYVGIYRVEIEHPGIATAGAKPLGFELNPASRDGASASFDL